MLVLQMLLLLVLLRVALCCASTGVQEQMLHLLHHRTLQQIN
jgi:hypothetical protein